MLNLKSKGTKIFEAIVVVGILLLISYSVKRKDPSTRGTLSGAEGRTYNLILISIDTVRADALQLYNAAGASTPGLNRIAEKAHVFTNTISQVPYTLPSHCSMFTGTYPMMHGVQENLTAKLSQNAVTLAETLKENGYITAGFAGSTVMSAHTGIDQGFDLYDDSFSQHNKQQEDMGGVQKTADEVYKSFQRWFEKRNPGKFFAFIHFYDPHLPYEPPTPFTPMNRTDTEMYKGELRYVDSVISKMFDQLSTKGIWDDTVLIITGDHGEMLGEHQENGHGYFIYQEALKVPLLISIPKQAQTKTIANPVQLVDLMPTILELLNIPVHKEIQGESFASFIEGKHSLDHHLAFSESLTGSRYFGAAPLRSIQDHKYKYIDSPRPELFNLQIDPHEKSNLIQQEAEIASVMKKQLDEIVKRYSVSSEKQDPVRAISPEEAEQLASLGYLGTSGTAHKLNPSRDAKDYIDSWNDLNKLTGLLQNEKYREALSLINDLKRIAPFSSDVKIFEARAWSGLGDHDKAIQILDKVISANPENTQALMALAYSLRNTGQTDKAAAIYRKLIGRDNSILALQNYARMLIHLNKQQELLTQLNAMNAQGKLTERHDEILGEIYLSLNDLDNARAYLGNAIEANPGSLSAHINLSSVLDSQGKTAEAIVLLEGNRHRFENADYEVQLGRLYHNTGNRKKEFEIFQNMVEKYNQDPRGYFFLAQILLEKRSDLRSVIKLAEKGLSLNPDAEFEPFGYFLLGDAYTALGMKKEAQYYLNRAEQLSAKSTSP